VPPGRLRTDLPAAPAAPTLPPGSLTHSAMANGRLHGGKSTGPRPPEPAWAKAGGKAPSAAR